ncbi:tetratricopeptide repeat-containing sensor histidine kinase [Salegentibacter sp. HM20]
MIQPRILFSLLLVSAIFSACSEKPENTSETTEDSAFSYFEKAREASAISEKLGWLDKALKNTGPDSDTLLSQLLDYKIYYHNQLKNYDSAAFYIDSLQQSSTRRKDTVGIAKAYYRRAVLNRLQNNPEENFRNSFESRKYYLAIGDSTAFARRSLEMAVAQSRMNDYSGSQETATEALKYLNQALDSSYLSSAHNVIAIAYRQQGFEADAVREYENALKFSTKPSDSLSYLNNIAMAHSQAGKYEAARQNMLEVLKKVNPEDSIAYARYKDNLAWIIWQENPETDIEAELLEALKLRKAVNDKTGMQASYEHLARFYENRNPEKAIAMAREQLNTAKANGSATGELDALKNLLDLSPTERDGLYIDRFVSLNDSLNRANLQAKNAFAKIRLDEERNRQQIQNLQTRSLQQRLEAENLKNRSIILGLIILILVLGAVFYVYFLRQRNRKEKIRVVHKTESQISKKIHDELANDLYNLMTLLEPIAPNSSMDRLERLYQRTRDISRENAAIPTGSDFGRNLIESLKYNSGRARLILKGASEVDWEKISDEKKIVIYRVLQELMINMKKHSQAPLVAVLFEKKANKLHINFNDTGIGADLKQFRSKNGLQNVETRIFSVNGSISFDSAEGKGFRVAIQIPY